MALDKTVPALSCKAMAVVLSLSIIYAVPAGTVVSFGNLIVCANVPVVFCTYVDVDVSVVVPPVVGMAV